MSSEMKILKLSHLTYLYLITERETGEQKLIQTSVEFESTVVKEFTLLCVVTVDGTLLKPVK